jgi:hypothetical protein
MAAATWAWRCTSPASAAPSGARRSRATARPVRLPGRHGGRQGGLHPAVACTRTPTVTRHHRQGMHRRRGLQVPSRARGLRRPDQCGPAPVRPQLLRRLRRQVRLLPDLHRRECGCEPELGKDCGDACKECCGPDDCVVGTCTAAGACNCPSTVPVCDGECCLTGQTCLGTACGHAPADADFCAFSQCGRHASVRRTKMLNRRFDVSRVSNAPMLQLTVINGLPNCVKPMTAAREGGPASVSPVRRGRTDGSGAESMDQVAIGTLISPGPRRHRQAAVCQTDAGRRLHATTALHADGRAPTDGPRLPLSRASGEGAAGVRADAPAHALPDTCPVTPRREAAPPTLVSPPPAWLRQHPPPAAPPPAR